MPPAAGTEASLSPEVASRAQRWAQELEWAENAVEYDPTNAFDVSRHTERELEDWAHEHPEQRRSLAELIARARVDRERTDEARRRFVTEGALRERHFHRRELAEIATPLPLLRQPYAASSVS